MKILCFADDRKTVKAELKSNACELFKTLVKLYLYPNHESVSHWKQEIAAFLNRVSKLKGSNKLPSKEFILKNTWSIYEDLVPNMVKPTIEDYGPTEVKINVIELHSKCKLYFDWIAEELSSNGLVSNKSIYEKLDSIFNL